MRFRQIEEFLLSLHQAEAGDAARAHRNQGLDDVEASSLRIGIWVPKGEDSITPVADVENQYIECGDSGQERVRKITHTHARNIKDAHGDAGAGNGGPEVRLKDNEAEGHEGGNNGRNQGVAPIIHRLCTGLEEVGEK